MPTTKEIYYFGSDLRFRNYKITEDQYYAFFEKCEHETAIGEGSVLNLYSKTAAKEIRQFNPHSKAIIMIRNPVDMMYSMYHHMRFYGQEPISSFEEALEIEPERINGRNIPSYIFSIDSLFYRSIAQFSSQISRYIDIFGKNDVLVIIHDDFKENTKNEYKKILNFLDVDDTYFPDFRHYNVNRVSRLPAVNRLTLNPQSPTANFMRKVIPIKKLRKKIRKTISKVNKNYLTVEAPRAPMDSGLRATLIKEFASEIDQLEILLDRDLSSWRLQSEHAK